MGARVDFGPYPSPPLNLFCSAHLSGNGAHPTQINASLDKHVRVRRPSILTRFRLVLLEEASNPVYIDAPHALLAVDHPGTIQSDGAGSNSTITISGQPARAWWRFLYTMRDVPTALESFEYIQGVLETQGPFDASSCSRAIKMPSNNRGHFQGILGFSQGASFAALITAYLENREMKGNLLKDVKHPPLQFAVLFSGFYAPNEAIQLPNNIRTPSLHIFGIHDIMVAPENMARLSTYFDSPRVEIHHGGHFIPRTLNWRHFLTEYLNSTGGSSQVKVPGSEIQTEIRSPTLPTCREELEIVRRTIKGLDGQGFALFSIGVLSERVLGYFSFFTLSNLERL
ncbi:serine hydrolase-domain-containing protein [Roridomyces roridus]|uniref:Serine hydrolase-domain-containing protein n=1 Tax=Roridomyces roridus TaxID=1738132 RepID=A0AAD7BF27_9AGAR|nr:serine hydrolase-domain-containing protein [Roridomyces roridus]